ncbi:hypothetical protein D1007_61464 [Hordeum vulgare]|nr:hypothetical protein D1007_61464 [Hordeum vulgare]
MTGVVTRVPQLQCEAELPIRDNVGPPRPAGDGYGECGNGTRGREARERLEAEAAAEAYMKDLRCQQPEFMKAERAIFADNGTEVIVNSDEV